MSPATRNRLPMLVSLGALYFIWGTTYLGMRIVVLEVSPFASGAARFLVAGTVLMAVMKVRGLPWPTLREWLYAVPVGICLFLCGNGLVGRAEQHLSSAAAAVVCATTPLFTAAIAPLFGEKFRREEIWGTVLGFAGVLLLFSGAEFKADLKSALILTVAPMAWSFGSLLMRKVPVARGLMSAATHMITGGLALAVVSAIRGELFVPNPSAKAVGAWVYLVIFGSLVSFSAYNWLMRNTRPSLALSYSYVNPVIAVLVGAALGNERLGPEMVPALILITLATVVTVRAKTSPPPAAIPAGAERA